MENRQQQRCRGCGVLRLTPTDREPRGMLLPTWAHPTIIWGSNNLRCWPVLGGHDREAIFLFYRAHCAEGLTGLSWGRQKIQEPGAGSVLPHRSPYPNPLCTPTSQCSSPPNPAAVGGGIWGCSSPSIAALLPTQSPGLPREQPPLPTNPACAGRGRRGGKALCEELWGLVGGGKAAAPAQHRCAPLGGLRPAPRGFCSLRQGPGGEGACCGQGCAGKPASPSPQGGESLGPGFHSASETASAGQRERMAFLSLL